MSVAYDNLLNEFTYKGYKCCDWTNLEVLRYIENEIVFREDDILLVSYPKCGNTLLSEIVWLLKHCLKNRNLETAFDRALCEKIFTRVPFLELTNLHFQFQGFEKEVIPLEYLKKKRSKGEIIKTHLPWSILESTYQRHKQQGMKFPKIIFVTRNPKDALVSMDNFYRLCEELGPYKKDFHNFFQMWIDGCIVNGDYRQYHLDWFQGFKILTNSAYHLFFYEDCVENPKKVLLDLENFLFNKDLDSFNLDIEEVHTRIIEHTRFEKMKNNKMVNYEDVDLMVKDIRFMRKGIVKDWVNHFTNEQNEKFNDAYNDFFEKAKEFGPRKYYSEIQKYLA